MNCEALLRTETPPAAVPLIDTTGLPVPVRPLEAARLAAYLRALDAVDEGLQAWLALSSRLQAAPGVPHAVPRARH